MNSQEFVTKWRGIDFKERSFYQEHFTDICRLVGHPTPIEYGQKEVFSFEASADRGFADVCKRGYFAWEYKGDRKNLEAAYDQLLRYRESLQNPPLLIVSDSQFIRIHTNFTNTIKREYEITLDDLLISEKLEILRAAFFDPLECNFVHGAYLYVSTSLLYRVKRYISRAQRDSIDLYVTTKLLEREKPNIVGYFLDKYLHPNLMKSKSKRAGYYNQMAYIDESGLFYPVLLEELDFLGGKVFGDRKDDKIIIEVDDLVGFLENVSNRKVGDDETDLEFTREYCRFTIMIIGKPSKLENSIDPYVNFIRDNLHSKNIETIYVLGKWENREIIKEICDQIGDIYWLYRDRKTTTLLRYDDDHTEECDQIVIVLRLVGALLFQPG